MPSIYEVPVSMQQQGLDAAIMRKIGIPVGETPAMKPWREFLDKQRNATREVHVALVGKYDLQDAYKSIRESLNLAGIYNDVKMKIHFINSEHITRQNVASKLSGMAGVVICPGFGTRGIEGRAYHPSECGFPTQWDGWYRGLPRLRHTRHRGQDHRCRIHPYP